MTGVAFPSSRLTRFRGARSRIPQPTPTEPVNEMRRTRSSSTSTSPMSLAGPQRTFSQPAGSPASVSSSARSSAESGVCDAGLSTTAQPAARAGAILCATRFSGKLKGEIAATTPTGTRNVNASLPSPAGDASIGTTSPASLRASTAAIVNVETARCASIRAAFIGFPASAQIVRATSSWRSARAAAVRSRIAARSWAGSGSLHRALGRVDCPPRLVGARLRNPSDDRAVVGRAHLDPLAGLDPLAADEQLPLGRGGGHVVSVDAGLRRFVARRCLYPVSHG